MKKMIVSLLIAILALNTAIFAGEASKPVNNQKPVTPTTQVEVAKEFVPTLSYQAILKDAKGNLLKDGEYKVSFKLYNAVDAKSPLYTEEQTVKVADGVVNAQIGSVKALELPFDKQYWLSLSIDQEEMERAPLSASAYSLQKNVKSLNGLTGELKIVGKDGVSVNSANGEIVISGGANQALRGGVGTQPTTITADVVNGGVVNTTTVNSTTVKTKTIGITGDAGITPNGDWKGYYQTQFTNLLGVDRGSLLSIEGQFTPANPYWGPTGALVLASAQDKDLVLAAGFGFNNNQRDVLVKAKRMRIGSNGSIFPSYVQGNGLHVDGSIYAADDVMTYDNVYIGAKQPAGKMWVFHNNTDHGTLTIAPSLMTGGKIVNDDWGNGLVVTRDGRLILGYSDNDPARTSKLSVNGNIWAKDVSFMKVTATEITVQANQGWADYVFADDYNRMSLDEVEAFVKENRHLPGVPSAKEIESKGINVSDMQKIFMEKIEELTLHMIDMKKENDELKKRVNALTK